MTTTPETPLFDSQSGRASDFEAGLVAFREAEYATAIVLLEPALAESPTHPLVARAQMGLAVSYEKMGETERAVQLCRSLQQHGNAQVQDWATRTLASFVQRHPELALNSGDTVDFAPTPLDVHPPVTTSEHTGFTPLDEATLPPATPPPWVNESPTSIAPAAAARSSSPPAGLNPAARSPKSRSVAPSANATIPPISLYQPHWRQAGRARQWKSLGKVNLLRLVGVQIITAIAAYFAVQQVLYWTVSSYGNAVIKTLPRLGFRIVQPGAPTWTESFTLLLLLLLLVSSRWLLDALLSLLYSLKPLSVSELSVYSPESASSLPRFCQKSKISVPALGLLPTQAPIIFSYGFLPNLSRTVVSQGLLEQLADDEIAALFANEVGHLAHWTVPLMSGILLLLQIPYTLYWVTAEWGNHKESPITKACATLISVLSYGLYWVWRWVPLWLSRQRAYYSDRLAAELTGNPNGYTRALLKLAIGTAKDVQQQQQASYFLEGWEVITPLGYRVAIPLGSLYSSTPVETILEWERTHPLRHWLALNNTHPPTGERLNLLTLYARHWRLDSELDWSEPPARRAKQAGLTAQPWRSLLMQGAPYFGLAFGVAIAFVLRLIGWIGLRARWDWVSWMANDRTILFGLPLVGLCIGILLRLNPFFPDLRQQSRKSGYVETLPQLLNTTTAIPLSSQPTQLTGTLLGRRGISNLLNQDLWLNTASGLVKLHCTSRLGVLSSFLPGGDRPANLVNTSLTVTGWFRRGTTSWIDVETLRTAGGRTHSSHHPVWGLVIAAIAATCGILAIFNF
jgi:Zn-dependent protease with chaperone function